MKGLSLIILLVFTLFSACQKKDDDQKDDKVQQSDVYKLQKPSGGQIYHAAFPDFGGTEDIVSTTAITNFENLAGKPIAWAYFSNNWTSPQGIHFPLQEVNTIVASGRVPFIRIMPRSNFDAGGPDPQYTMDRILSGSFDNQIKAWAIAARTANIPLLAEFGTEVNGDWFPWNATYNGANQTGYGDTSEYDGMEKFKLAYRHIIDICRDNGVRNITWFYHVDAYNSPDVAWNTMKGYYPGDDYIDWIGVSVYGAQSSSDSWVSFESVLNDAWNELSHISNSNKPIAILEWGVIDQPSLGDKAQWISQAFQSVTTGSYAGKISAMSYWHENFTANGETINLRIDSSTSSLNAYQNGVSDAKFISTVSFDN